MFPLIVVFGTVLLGIASATILKESSLRIDWSWIELTLVFLLVAIVNGLRFFLWGIVHRKYPISWSYLLSSLFFPLILTLSYFSYGEALTLEKVIGVFLIVAGVALITYFEQNSIENKE